MLHAALALGLALSLAAAAPPDPPLTGRAFMAAIRKGFVTEWAEFDEVIENYSDAWPRMIANVSGAPNSFDFVRLRVSGGDVTMADTFAKLDAPVNDSLAAGLHVFIAYKGWVNSTTEADAHAAIVEWWRQTAAHFADYSHRLAFDVFIEIGHAMCHGPSVAKSCPAEAIASKPHSLRALYVDVLAAIRATNPDRVVAFTPGVCSPHHKPFRCF